MTRTIISGEFLGFTQKEKLAMCRKLAEQAESLANDAANPETRRAYLDLKRQWNALAADLAGED